MKQLIKNELIKLRAQKTYVVLSCIVLALVVIVSFCTSVLVTPLNNLMANRSDFITKSYAYSWAIEKIQEDPDSALAGVLRTVFKDPKSDGDKYREQAQDAMENEYMYAHADYTARAAFSDFRDANDLPDWIIRAVEDRLINYYTWEQIYLGIENGTYTVEHMLNEYGLFYMLTGLFDDGGEMHYDMRYEYNSVTEEYTMQLIRYDENGVGEPCTWEEFWEYVSGYKPVCDQCIAQIEQYALTLEPDAYYDSLIAEKQAKIEDCENSIKTLEESLANPDPESTEWERAYYELELAYCRGTIEDLEQIINAYETLRQKGSSPDGNAFMMVNQILPSVLETRRNALSSYDRSEINGEFVLLVKAQQSGLKHQIRVLDKALVAIEYAVDHDMLPEDLHQSSAKSTLISNLTTASFLISAITIVLASMILSREFATGTVRLWVIRPKTRNKLLGSKIAALFIYVCTMMGASFVITFAFALVNHLIDLFFYGKSTLFVGNLGVVFGKTVIIPAVAELLWALVVLTLPVLLYAMLCLFVSVLTKKGVLSIVCGMIVLMFATDIQALALIVANYTGAFGYVLQATVLPYLSMDRLLVTSLDFGVAGAIMGSIDGLGALIGLEDMLMSQIWGAIPYVCSSFVGAAVLALHILLLVWASLFAFKRTQIKS